MASNRVWNLMYVLGNTGRVVSDAANPQDRAGALSGAETVAGNGWRVWVEHEGTGKRIFESKHEIEFQGGPQSMSIQDGATQTTEVTHGCGHMQGRGAA